jgi:hypothetical protein
VRRQARGAGRRVLVCDGLVHAIDAVLGNAQAGSVEAVGAVSRPVSGAVVAAGVDEGERYAALDDLGVGADEAVADGALASVAEGPTPALGDLLDGYVVLGDEGVGREIGVGMGEGGVAVCRPV